MTNDGNASRLENVENLKFNELRGLCKELGLPAAGKAVDLRERLKSFRVQEEEEKRSLPSSSMDAVQVAAMNTPLPKVQKIHRKKRGGVCGGGLVGMLMVLGLIGIVVAVGSRMVVCPRYRGQLERMCEVVDTGYRVVRDNDVVVRVGRYVSSMSIPGRVEQALEHVKEHMVPFVRTVLIRGVDDIQTFLLERKKNTSQEKSTKRLNPAVLDALVGSERNDVDSGWASTWFSLEEVWEMRKISKPDKANVVLFVCTSVELCQSAEDELTATADASSVLKLFMENDKGEVQSRLGRFLKEEPRGVVVIPRIERWSAVLISVLNNALGEGGSLVVDGESIPASEATYFITMEVPKSIVESHDSAPSLNSAVKMHLMKILTGGDIVHADEMVQAVADSLRRRIDVVANVLLQ